MIRLSLELKVIVYVLLFGIFLIGFQRYYLSTTAHEEFVHSKQSKNALLADTVTPIVTLNMALGLNAANEEYLENLAAKNRDIKHLEIVDDKNNTVYVFTRYPATLDPGRRSPLNFSSRDITDPYNNNLLGRITIDFFENDLMKMQRSYRDMALFTLAVSLIAVVLFILLLKQEFRRLRRLSENVLSYDPAKREFPVTPSDRRDEVGIIQNAIINMVDKLNTYAGDLDEANKGLEEKILSRTRELKIANEQLEKLSLTDTLTGLPNRRHFEQQYMQMWEIAKRNGMILSVVICDIDFFKKINDAHGHLVGDAVLKKIAEILKTTSKRSTDYIARIGGEEFILILPDADDAHAKEFCEKIRQQMQSLSVVVDENTVLENITFSFGVSTMVPEEEMWPKVALKRADDALYEAKDSGRNTVVVYEGATGQ
jgi:diguanylate cyclase (GGDEF)-like protein